jgi:hypothetical protein
MLVFTLWIICQHTNLCTSATTDSAFQNQGPLAGRSTEMISVLFSDSVLKVMAPKVRPSVGQPQSHQHKRF